MKTTVNDKQRLHIQSVLASGCCKSNDSCEERDCCAGSSIQCVPSQSPLHILPVTTNGHSCCGAHASSGAHAQVPLLESYAVFTFRLSTTIFLVTWMAKLSGAVPLAASRSLLEGKSAKATSCDAGGAARLLAPDLLLFSPRLLSLLLPFPACLARRQSGQLAHATTAANGKAVR